MASYFIRNHLIDFSECIILCCWFLANQYVICDETVIGDDKQFFMDHAGAVPLSTAQVNVDSAARFNAPHYQYKFYDLLALCIKSDMYFLRKKNYFYD